MGPVTVVHGVVGADGQVVSGAGFRVEKAGTGTYDVYFDGPFASAPTVVSVVCAADGGERQTAVVRHRDRFGTRIVTCDDDGYYSDRGFAFTAMS
ncbi:hypothetical protein [Streptomyces griseocarneus]|uniref:hypothetical protein n=1 Tax=Streptomyces griseocarneus TaxID=51201 RepID=UPI00167CF58F|nr:hypothetical protein [Streptomyces griseocarneus]MBZ6476324.1 hypothetical protein [Streptomyces griseocarneus]GHG78176.1 hypothetical protein GCM10018779_57790 [Streptomyces griseocarneus]